MDGPAMIGSFRGKVKASDVVVQEFTGDSEAKALLTKHLKALGLTIRVPNDNEIPDWEVQEFYEKTHPGEV
jgi:hypothetical protein